MDKRIKVTFGIARLTYGGTETQLYELIRRIDRDRFEPSVLVVREGGENYERFASTGCPVDVAGRRSRYDPGILARCAAAIRERRPDIVYSLLVTANFWVRAAAKIAGAPVIIAGERGVLRDRKTAAFIPDRMLAGITDLVIVNAPAVKESYSKRAGVSPGKIVVIPNGVDTEVFRPGLDAAKVREELGIHAGRRVIGVVSRLHPMKGLEGFIDAAAALAKSDSGITALLVGDGPLKTALERRASEKCPPGSVIFAGYREDVPMLLNAMDVLVFPSLTEGLSNSLVEGAAAGRAIVASGIEENRYVVENGKTGLLTEPGNVSSLESAVRRLLADDMLRARLGAAARESAASKFSYSFMVRSHENLFVELVNRKSVAG